MTKKVTAKQARFVEEYLCDLNATQAAIRAGYSRKTAYSQGQRLLKHVEVKAALRKQAKALARKQDVTAARVLSEYASIAFADLGPDVTLTPAHKLDALKAIGQHLHLFDDDPPPDEPRLTVTHVTVVLDPGGGRPKVVEEQVVGTHAREEEPDA